MNSRRVLRARALLGTPFRPQGRDPASGLDCIGLVIVACGLPVDCVRRDYRIGTAGHDELRAGLERFFRQVTRGSARGGDILLLEAGRGRPHLAIATELGFIHADVGARRIVEVPGEPRWQLLARFRQKRRVTNERDHGHPGP